MPIFFFRTDDSQCDKIHFFLTTVHCFADGYVEKQPLDSREEYCAEHLLKNSRKAWIYVLAAAI